MKESARRKIIAAMFLLYCNETEISAREWICADLFSVIGIWLARFLKRLRFFL